MGEEDLPCLEEDEVAPLPLPDHALTGGVLPDQLLFDLHQVRSR